MTRPLAVALLLGACGAAHVAPDGTSRDDREAAVFGAEAWRVPGSVDFIGFAGDNMIVATQGGAVVRFARDGTRTIIAERALADVTDVAMQGDALLLANEQIVRVDLGNGATSHLDLGRSTSALAVANGRAVVGEGGEGPLRVIDLATRKVIAELEHSRGYVAPHIVGDWVLAGRYERAAAIWQLATGKRHRVFAVGNSTLFAMSPDRQLIATGTFHASSLYVIDVHRIDSGERTAMIGVSCSPSALAFSPASDRLALACDDEVHVVKVPGGDEVAKLAGSRSYVRSLAWSPTGDILALGGNDNVLHAWRTDSWQPLSLVTGSRGAIRELAVAGRFLASHSWGDSSAWLWVTDLVKPAIELGGKGREILAVAGDGDDILVAVNTSPDAERRASIERWRGVSRVAQTSLRSGRFGMSPLVRGLGPVRGGGVWFTAEGHVTILDAELRPRWTSPSSDRSRRPNRDRRRRCERDEERRHDRPQIRQQAQRDLWNRTPGRRDRVLCQLRQYAARGLARWEAVRAARSEGHLRVRHRHREGRRIAGRADERRRGAHRRVDE